MNKIYLIGNGYVSDFITDKYSCDYEFVGVCRSEKNNCKHNYSIGQRLATIGPTAKPLRRLPRNVLKILIFSFNNLNTILF